MKIVTQCSSDQLTLGELEAGDVFRFLRSIPNKHKGDDPFIVLSVSGSYRPYKQYMSRRMPDQGGWGSKTALANLRTGELAYFSNERQVEKLDDATLTLEGC